MNTYLSISRFLALLLALVSLTLPAARAATFQVPIAATGGAGGTITGAYSFNGGLSTINATNVYLAPAISNLVLNLAITNIGASNRVLMSASETRITNAFKRYYFDTNVAHILSNLVAGAASGDVVELGSGDFRIGTQTIRPPVGVTLRGQGMGVTRIIGDVGVATNSIVQLMSTNIIEDLTVVAGKKSLSTFQYPIANVMIFGHPAATNVILRRVEIDGETDCLLISQTNNTSGTIEDSNFHSAWDVCNILDLDDGNAAPGANWTIRRTRLYADSATAQNPQGVANPKSQPFIAAGAIVNLINCELTATNHKAITIILQGFETNLISIFDGTLQSAGTNGFGKQVDITTDSDNSVSTVKVSGTLINDTVLAATTVVSYEPRQVSTMYAAFTSILTNRSSYSFITNSVTAQSFIGAGTGTPYLLLSSPNGAAFGITVDTNRTVQTTNTFNFTSVAVGDDVRAHTSSAGQIVWTNASSKILTNLVGMSFDYGLLYAATNTVAGTNIAINFSPNSTNHIDFFTTNWWCQWTNISGLAQGSLANKTIRITPSAPGQNLTNIWPVGKQHGIYQWTTNANSPIWTVLTNAKTYVLSLTAYGTNIHASMSLWEP